jgi:methionyl-tRNA formyltransferase
VVVVFFGTPEFAVPSLRALVGEGFDVRAVVTRPDRPQGRSRSTAVAPPVKVAALAEGLEVLQPERPTDPDLMHRLRQLAPDVGVVVAYGHILKPDLLAIPRRGMVNVHPSLLPELRGAAPVEWAILNGDETTGVTIMQLDAGMDSGPILHQLPHHIVPGTTGGELSEHLAEMGAQALIEALALWEQDGLKLVPQDHTRATHAPKLTREIARIDWTKPAITIARQIWALDPKPGAWAMLGAAEVKLFDGHVVEQQGGGAPGEVLQADTRLLIACGEGSLEVDEVQPAGKERMPAADWIRGRGVSVGQKFA